MAKPTRTLSSIIKEASDKTPATTIAHQNPTEPLHTERRRQIRGLLLLAFVIFVFSIFRAGIHNIFHAGWWRLW